MELRTTHIAKVPVLVPADVDVDMPALLVAEVVRILREWADLPQSIRDAILVLVDSATNSTGPRHGQPKRQPISIKGLAFNCVPVVSSEPLIGIAHTASSPALQSEGRTPQQQRHRRRQFALRQEPVAEGEVEWRTAEATRQGQTTRQRLRDRRRIRCSARRVVWQHFTRSRRRPRVLYLGRLFELRQLPAVPQEVPALFQPSHHLG
jgi:hypothetical protein